jgi:hypothetical protein
VSLVFAPWSLRKAALGAFYVGSIVSCGLTHAVSAPTTAAPQDGSRVPAPTSMVDSGLAIRAPQDEASAPTVGGSATPVAGAVAFDASYASSDHPPAQPDRSLALWNEGGSRRTRSAAVSPAYQPVPRVVVDVRATDGRPQPATVARALDQIQAQLRSLGYWPFRHCFEAGLRDAPALEGETRLSLSVSARGRVLKCACSTAS